MGNIDYESKMNSKSYRFFDLLYRLLVINLIVVILSVTIVLIYPAAVAAMRTLKDGNTGDNVFKQYFINFKTYFKKSFLVGLIFIILYAVLAYAIYFYGVSKVKDGETDNVLQEFLNIGFLVSFVGFILLTFIQAHAPLLIMTFKSLTVGELLKTTFFVTFYRILSTLIIFIFDIIMIGGITLAFLFDARILAIWLLVGVSLPMFLIVKITYVVYSDFEKVNLEKIMHRIEEEEDDEK